MIVCNHLNFLWYNKPFQCNVGDNVAIQNLYGVIDQGVIELLGYINPWYSHQKLDMNAGPCDSSGLCCSSV